MTRDYKQRRPRATRRKRPQTHRLSRSLLYTLSLGFLILVLGWLWLKQPTQNKPIKKNTVSPSIRKKQTPPEPSLPRFDFYNLLSSDTKPKLHQTQLRTTSLSPKQNITPSSTQRQQQVAQAVSTQISYELRHYAEPNRTAHFRLIIDSFKTLSLAEKQLTHLRKQGIIAHLARMGTGDATRYQVWLGPYSTQATAQQQQQQLATQKINSSLVKIP